MAEDLLLIDPGIVDIYADEVTGLENLGSTFRTTYATYRQGPSGPERVVVARIIRPIKSLIGVRGGGFHELLRDPTTLVVPRRRWPTN